MRRLIYGTGCAREHATFRRLACEAGGSGVHFALEGRNALLAAAPGVHRVDGLDAAVRLAGELGIDQVLVLSPGPLIAGAADAFAAAGIPVFGPSGAAARLEASKALGKEIMAAAGVPTPEFRVVEEPASAERFVRDTWRTGRCEWVLKSDDFLANAAYRTLLPDDADEACRLLRHLLRDGPPEERSARVLLEERVEGPEMSLHVLCDGRSYVVMPPVCDYKRRDDGDRGPNTHGMGAVASSHAASRAPLDAIARRIVEPTLNELARRGLCYRGVLYIGLILTDEGYRVLEYNVRPGNPEWLALLGLLETPLAEVIDAVMAGRLDRLQVAWRPERVAGAVFAVGGTYPFTGPGDAMPLERLDEPDERDMWLVAEDLHRAADGSLWAGGGRVAACAADAPDVETLRARLRRGLAGIAFTGMHSRTDIGRDRPLLHLPTPA